MLRHCSPEQIGRLRCCDIVLQGSLISCVAVGTGGGSFGRCHGWLIDMVVSAVQVLEDEVDAKESSGIGYLRSGSGRTKTTSRPALGCEKS
jgi:hypothetical protein